jgi:hypothetical protein
MSVPAAVLCVSDARAGRVVESEFGFVVTYEIFDDGFRIGAVRRRVDVHVMHWARRAAVCRSHYEIINLIAQRLAHQVTRRHDFNRLVTLARHQMPSKSGAAGAACSARNHSCNL